MPTSPRRKKEAEADGYKTSQCFRLGETQRSVPTSLTQPAWPRATEVGLGGWVLGHAKGVRVPSARGPAQTEARGPQWRGDGHLLERARSVEPLGNMDSSSPLESQVCLENLVISPDS